MTHRLQQRLALVYVRESVCANVCGGRVADAHSSREDTSPRRLAPGKRKARRRAPIKALEDDAGVVGESAHNRCCHTCTGQLVKRYVAICGKTRPCAIRAVSPCERTCLAQSYTMLASAFPARFATTCAACRKQRHRCLPSPMRIHEIHTLCAIPSKSKKSWNPYALACATTHDASLVHIQRERESERRTNTKTETDRRTPARTDP